MYTVRFNYRAVALYFTMRFKDALERSDVQGSGDVFSSMEPIETSDYEAGGFKLVGHDKITNANCGRFESWYGCLRTELHGRVTLDGKTHKGEIFVKKYFHSCDKPSCPVCFKKGWASHAARRVDAKISHASKVLNLKPEHIIASVPISQYGLPFEKVKANMLEAISKRGVIGGVMIFHAFRYNDPYEARMKNHPNGWYWNPHFHIIGFFDKGYGKCRGCKKYCFCSS